MTRGQSITNRRLFVLQGVQKAMFISKLRVKVRHTLGKVEEQEDL